MFNYFKLNNMMFIYILYRFMIMNEISFKLIHGSSIKYFILTSPNLRLWYYGLGFRVWRLRV